MVAENLDAIDSQIIKALLKDGRVHFTELADDIGVSTGTVHLRFDKLTI